jgi:hypothetical protein
MRKTVVRHVREIRSRFFAYSHGTNHRLVLVSPKSSKLSPESFLSQLTTRVLKILGQVQKCTCHQVLALKPKKTGGKHRAQRYRDDRHLFVNLAIFIYLFIYLIFPLA